MYFIRLFLFGLVFWGSGFPLLGLAESPQISASQQQVYEIIVSTQRVGWEQGKLSEYMKVWAPEAKVVSARTLDDDTYKVEFDRTQNEQIQTK